MDCRTFSRLADTHFSQLCHALSLEPGPYTEEPGECTVWFTGPYAALRIELDLRDRYVFASVHKMVAGAPAPFPKSVTDDTELEAHDLDTVLQVVGAELRWPGQIDRHADLSQRSVAQALAKVSDAVSIYLTPILSGDFTLFPLLSAAVRERAQKWKARGTTYTPTHE
jgi:hypothetical protein